MSSYKETPDERFDEITQYLRDALQKVQNYQQPEQGNLF